MFDSIISKAFEKQLLPFDQFLLFSFVITKNTRRLLRRETDQHSERCPISCSELTQKCTVTFWKLLLQHNFIFITFLMVWVSSIFWNFWRKFDDYNYWWPFFSHSLKIWNEVGQSVGKIIFPPLYLVQALFHYIDLTCVYECDPLVSCLLLQQRKPGQVPAPPLLLESIQNRLSVSITRS